MEDTIKDSFDKAAAFQNMWMDSMAGMARVWSQYSPENPPPEELKRMRQGMLNVISRSWEEFMRTPQFMEMMKESLNNAMTWQGFAKDGANRIHDTFQTSSKSDVEGILLSLRHVEKRLLDELETTQEQVEALGAKVRSLGSPSKEEASFRAEVLAKLAKLEKAGSAETGKAASPRAKKTVAKRTTAKRTARKTTRKS